MRLFGLTGFPLSHSFSKTYFEAKFKRDGIPGCRFENFPLTGIEQLPGLIAGNPDLEGLAVTIPYKKAVLPFLHEAHAIAAELAACNCIRIRNGKLEGFNTDITGFEQSFVPLLKPHHRAALVLGNGGAAAAVIYVLRKTDMPFHIVSRTPHNESSFSYQDINAGIIKDHQVIINTTPLGMFPDVSSCPDIPYDAIGKDHLLFDLVYNPATTKILDEGLKRGAAIQNGEQMLILQAEENWRIWNS